MEIFGKIEWQITSNSVASRFLFRRGLMCGILTHKTIYFAKFSLPKLPKLRRPLLQVRNASSTIANVSSPIPTECGMLAGVFFYRASHPYGMQQFCPTGCNKSVGTPHSTPNTLVLPFQPLCRRAGRVSPTLPPGGRQPTSILNGSICQL